MAQISRGNTPEIDLSKYSNPSDIISIFKKKCNYLDNIRDKVSNLYLNSESDIIQGVNDNIYLNTNIHNNLFELYNDIFVFFSANQILIIISFIMFMLPCAMFLVNLVFDGITMIIIHIRENIFSLLKLIIKKFAGNSGSENITSFFNTIKNYTGKDKASV
jgi:hypothetical protein